MNDILLTMHARGRSGELSFDGSHVQISHEGRSAKLIHGRGVDPKMIPLTSVAAVQFQPATIMFHGYIQIELVGRPAARFKDRSYFGGLSRNRIIAKNEDSIVFGVSVTDDFKLVADAIMASL